MQRREIDAPEALKAPSRYAQAVELRGPGRVLHVSGQVPVRPDGALPEGFGAQCRQAWANLEAQLRAAGMTLDHLVRVTIFLADRAHALENRRIREEILGERRPALTAIINGIFDEAWLVEIEAIAAAPG